ncbi:MAG: hypothetical protein KAQ68_06575 [Clostridiales bacterium]|nr:hypothetical protein [Clostridiales bacterium]
MKTKYNNDSTQSTNNMRIKPLLFGIIGALLFFFIGWEYNIPLMVWVAFPMLMFAFRSARKWVHTLPFIALLIVVKYLSMRGGWEMELWLQIVLCVVGVMPLVLPLLLDRSCHDKIHPLVATLLFPSAYLILDYLLTFLNVGMTLSLAYSQSTFLVLAQSASLLGSWFIGFMATWFAPIILLLLRNLSKNKITWKLVIIYFSIFTALIMYGSLRMVISVPKSPTVRIASITVAHEQNYWDITDDNTPKEDAAIKKTEMKALQDNLFDLSQKSADYGAKIIFWSEGNYPLYEDDYVDFIDKAKHFAIQNQVYFMPACVMLRYNQTKNDNIAIMIDPEGKIAYNYEKTISWYPTDSDGIIPTIETPYGKVSTAICLDMDVPSMIQQANMADIMLVPGYDTKKIADYHTRVSFLRGIENGFSVVRQANLGTSISADYLGNTLSYQSFFYTDENVMISDVPTKGVWTLYGATGEIFLWIVIAGFIIIMGRHIWTLGRKK